MALCFIDFTHSNQFAAAQPFTEIQEQRAKANEVRANGK